MHHNRSNKTRLIYSWTLQLRYGQKRNAVVYATRNCNIKITLKTQHDTHTTSIFCCQMSIKSHVITTTQACDQCTFGTCRSVKFGRIGFPSWADHFTRNKQIGIGYIKQRHNKTTETRKPQLRYICFSGLQFTWSAGIRLVSICIACLHA